MDIDILISVIRRNGNFDKMTYTNCYYKKYHIKDDKYAHVLITNKKKKFIIICNSVLYVYNSYLLNNTDAALINRQVQRIGKIGVFVDPLINTHKRAKIIKL